MKVSVGAILLALAFPLLTFGGVESGLDSFGFAGDNSWLEASIAGQWSDWPGDIPAMAGADSEAGGVYSGEQNLVAAGAVGGEGVPDGDKSDRITGVMALAFALGAFRLYFTSRTFRKFLFDTFSPLSPLSY